VQKWKGKASSQGKRKYQKKARQKAEGWVVTDALSFGQKGEVSICRSKKERKQERGKKRACAIAD